MRSLHATPSVRWKWAAALFVVASGISPLGAATIRGTVSSPSGVLEDMVVSAWRTSGTLEALATSDSTGRYEISLPGGQYKVLAYDPKGKWATAFDRDADSFDTTPVLSLGSTSSATRDFRLVRAGFIEGSVRGGGSARSDATVTAYNLSGTRRGFTESGSGGKYSLALPPGQYKLAAWDANGRLGTLFYATAPSFDDATILTVTSGATQSGRDFALDAIARLSGTISDEDSQTLLGIDVTAHTPGGSGVASTTSGPDGTFDLDVPAGTYRLVASDPGLSYATAYYGGANTFRASATVQVAPGGEVDSLDITMQNGGIVTGRVSNSNGSGLSGMKVVAYNLDGSPRAETTTESDGAYSLALPPGSFRFGAYDLRYTYATRFYSGTPVFEDAPTVRLVTDVVMSGIDITLPRAGTLQGVVVDAGGGAHLPHMVVSAWNLDGFRVAESMTDSTGAYKIAVAGGSYRFIVWDPGRVYANAFDGGASNFESTIERTVSENQVQTSNFALPRGIPLTGRCVTSSLGPVRGIEISILDTQGNHVATTMSGDDGAFLLPLRPGNYILAMRDPMGRYQTSYYDQASDPDGASILEIEAGEPPPAIELIVVPTGRRPHPARRP